MVDYEARVKEALEKIDYALKQEPPDLGELTLPKKIYADGLEAGIKAACEQIRAVLDPEGTT